jgi:hypothetical protein
MKFLKILDTIMSLFMICIGLFGIFLIIYCINSGIKTDLWTPIVMILIYLSLIGLSIYRLVDIYKKGE